MLRFYICRICGNLIEMIEDSGNTPVCCHQNMEELIPESTDGAKEKHVPVFCETSNSKSKDKDASHTDPVCTKVVTVKVGEIPHPMKTDHFISWVIVCTKDGVFRKKLMHHEPAQADFILSKGDRIKAVYSYCNRHGLYVNIPDHNTVC